MVLSLIAVLWFASRTPSLQTKHGFSAFTSSLDPSTWSNSTDWNLFRVYLPGNPPTGLGFVALALGLSLGWCLVEVFLQVTTIRQFFMNGGRENSHRFVFVIGNRTFWFKFLLRLRDLYLLQISKYSTSMEVHSKTSRIFCRVTQSYYLALQSISNRERSVRRIFRYASPLP